MKALFPFIFALLLSVFVPLSATADQGPAAIATVVAVRGQVTASDQAGLTRALAIKDPLHAEDTVRTGKQGRIQLLFNDATIISLAHDTEMKLAEYQWDPKAKTGTMKTQIKEGTFRVMGGALTKFAPKNFTTETPTATIGIRGSMYAGVATANSLSVVFQGGKGIDVTNAAGTVAITRPGFGTHVTGRDQPPTPPQKFSAAELGTINEALSGEPKVEEQPATPEGDSQGSTTSGQESSDGSQGTGGGTAGDESAPAAGTESFNDLGTGTAGGDTGAGTPLPEPEPIPQASLPLSIPTAAALVPAVIYDPNSDPTPPTQVIPAAAVLPTDGVSSYQGNVRGTSTPSGDIINDPLFMEVNWHNRQAIGIIADQSAAGSGKPVYFMGKVRDDGSITNVRIFGSDTNAAGGFATQLSAIDGSGTGRFSETDAALFSGSASGGEFSLALPGTPLQEQWKVTLSATRDPQDGADLTSPTGTTTWAGHAVGISENVNAPAINRKIFMNNRSDAPNDRFVLTIDKDTGTVTGSLRASQLDRVYNGALSLTIGGQYGSAYVLNDRIAAIIGCSGNCITSDDISVTSPDLSLNRYGNHLVTASPAEQFSEFATWGYWETSHQESDGTMYHTHAPYSMWVAGEKTSPAYVANLINNTSFVAFYEGMAQGTWIDELNHASRLTNGHSFVSVDFGQAEVSAAVAGSLVFDQVTLPFVSPAASGLGPFGFKADIIDINNDLVNAGTVNGSFYGPKADAIGGNFQAQIGLDRYIGIFGGKQTAPP